MTQPFSRSRLERAVAHSTCLGPVFENDIRIHSPRYVSTLVHRVSVSLTVNGGLNGKRPPARCSCCRRSGRFVRPDPHLAAPVPHGTRAHGCALDSRIRTHGRAGGQRVVLDSVLRPLIPPCCSWFPVTNPSVRGPPRGVHPKLGKGSRPQPPPRGHPKPGGSARGAVTHPGGQTSLWNPKNGFFRQLPNFGGQNGRSEAAFAARAPPKMALFLLRSGKYGRSDPPGSGARVQKSAGTDFSVPGPRLAPKSRDRGPVVVGARNRAFP